MANTIIQMQKVISSRSFGFSDPSNWTESLIGVRNSWIRTPGASQSFITIPLDSIEMQYTQYGYRIIDITLDYIMDTAAPTVGLAHGAFRIDYANGGSPSQTSTTGTYTSSFSQGGNATTSTNISATGQTMTIASVASNNGQIPWQNETGSLNRRTNAVQVSLTAAATTTLRIYGASVRYELPIG